MPTGNRLHHQANPNWIWDDAKRDFQGRSSKRNNFKKICTRKTRRLIAKLYNE